MPDFSQLVTINGTDAPDTLVGTLLDEALFGLVGDDTLTGDAGHDWLDGGDGTDTVQESANLDFTLTNDTLIGLGTDSLISIEKVVLNGGDGNNSLDAAGFTLGIVNLEGRQGNDTLSGGSRDDVLHGGDGDDTLLGNAGNDTLIGGLGDDQYRVDADTPLGRDLLVDSGGMDTLDLSATTSRVMTLNLSTTRLQVVSPNLAIQLSIQSSIEHVLGGSQKDRLTGSKQDNQFLGNGGADVLVGRGGEDTLTGNDGNDTLTGGDGNDTLTGGRGKDIFRFATGKRFKAARFGVDQITDFNPRQDHLVLDRTTFKQLDLAQMSFAIAPNKSQAGQNDAYIVYIPSTGQLYYNQNGNQGGLGSGGLFAELPDGLALTEAAFSVVI